jgi:hypothetical protein
MSGPLVSDQESIGTWPTSFKWKGESLREFIQCFCNKRNVIPEVDDKSIIMFFKKGLRDSSLIRKLTMKNPRTSKEILAIANKYALAEEATLDNRDTNIDSKMDKELSQSDRPSSSKSNDKKRKSGHSVANIERPCHNKTEYRPRLGEFEGFLDRICISIHRESTRLRIATNCKGLPLKS